MNTQQDFELTQAEIAELKAFLGNKNIRRGFSVRKPTYADLNRLTEPAQIKQYLSEINSLYLDYCAVPVPQSIRYLNNLEMLWIVGGNAVSELPEQIGQLKKLRFLQLSNLSKLTGLPEQICQLKELTDLMIDKCLNLTNLPEQIGELSKLEKLRIENCSNLKNLPESIGKLTQLKELSILICSNLITLPESIGQLKQLKKLELYSCKNLSFLPESLVELKQLEYFEPSACEKLTLSDGVQQLTMSYKHKDFLDKLAIKQGKKEKPALTKEQKQAKKVLAQIKKDTATPFVKIKIRQKKNLPLTASKFGGVPYWDLNKPYPVDDGGDKLSLLAQIDLTQVPPLPDFPQHGLLQFFIGLDDLVGWDSENPISQKSHRVVWHETVNQNITEKQVLALNIPLENMPLGDTQYQLSFKLGTQSMGLADYRFEDLFRTTAKKLNISLNENDKLIDLIDEDTYNKVHNSTTGHCMSGYPFFTQHDPREDELLSQYKILLLQVDSEDDIMWGDCGVGNFFITPDDLKKRDFSRVFYTWDCY